MSGDWLGAALVAAFVCGYLLPELVVRATGYVRALGDRTADREAHRARALAELDHHARASAADAVRQVEAWTDEAQAWMQSCEQVGIYVVDVRTGQHAPDSAARDVAILAHMVSRLINRHRLPPPIVESLALVAADVAERTRS